MPRGRPNKDAMTLQMALVGYEIERKKILEKISEVQSRLGKSGGAGETAPRKRRRLSAAARRRISAAQKRRWAAQKAAGNK